MPSKYYFSSTSTLDTPDTLEVEKADSIKCYNKPQINVIITLSYGMTALTKRKQRFVYIIVSLFCSSIALANEMACQKHEKLYWKQCREDTVEQ